MYGYWVKSKVNCCEFSQLFFRAQLHGVQCRGNLEECAQWSGGKGSYLPDWDFNKFTNCQTLIFELKTRPTTCKYDCVWRDVQQADKKCYAMSLQIQVKHNPSTATATCLFVQMHANPQTIKLNVMNLFGAKFATNPHIAQCTMHPSKHWTCTVLYFAQIVDWVLHLVCCTPKPASFSTLIFLVTSGRSQHS